MPANTRTLSELIMQAVKAGGCKVHNRYLPEVLALVCQRKLILIRADQNGIEVCDAS